MSLQLICGRSHSGKSTYILDVIENLIKQNQKIVLIVPEQFNHIAEKRLLKRVGHILDNSVEITSFNRLAQRTRDMAGDMRKDIITPTGKSLVMTEAISMSDLEYYKGISNEPGFTDTCINCISEFKKYSVDTGLLDAVSQKVDNTVLKYKLNDLNNIYKNYELLIGDKYIDTDDILDILYNLLVNNNFYNDTVFLFDEFSTFIPQEEKIISALVKKSKNVYMTLCMDKDLTKDLFLPTCSTYNKLVDMCKDNHYELCDTIWLDKTYYKSDVISFAENPSGSFSSSNRIFLEFVEK